MLAAEICKDDLHDAKRARALFHAAYARFPDWGERDVALWRESELFAKDGLTGEACATLAALAREFPDSRYVPCVRQRCPGVTPAPGGHAPAECHAYIEREASEEKR